MAEAGTETGRRDFPVSVHLYTALIAVAAATIALGDTAILNVTGAAVWPPVLGVAAFFMVRFRYRSEIYAFDLMEAFLVPVLVLFPPVGVVAVTAVGQAAAELLHRNSGVKARFNVAQEAFAAGVASLVFGALADRGVIDGRVVGAVVVAMGAMALTNHVALVGVFSLVQRRAPWRVLVEVSPPAIWIFPAFVVAWAVHVSFGVVFAAAFLQWSTVLPLLLLPLALLHLAARGYTSEQTNRARLEGLQRATHALGVPVDPREAIGRFLNEVRQSFEAETVDLAVCEEGAWVRYRVAGGEPGRTHFGPVEAASLAVAAAQLERAERITHGSADVTLGHLLRLEGWRDCVAAPVRIKDEVVGALCAYNRSGLEGFEEGELAVIEALAAEAASAIQRSELVEAILEERRKLSDIVESTSDGIFTLAADGAIRSWNTAMAELTGYGAEAMLDAQSVGILRPRDEQDTDVLLERWADAETSLPARVQVRTKQGASRWLDCSYTTSDGEERLLIVVARDITQVHEVNRLKADFVSIVSHELRTPIAPIKGFASTLLQVQPDQMDEATRRLALESILRQAQRLESLIMNLLEVSKIERGTQSSDVVPVDVVESCRRVIDELRPAWPKRTIELEGEETVVAVGRELWIDQIVTNLLSNALKYAPDEAPVVLRIEAADDAVSVSVVDRGPGVPEHERARIFERFERLHQHDMQAGTGLGLYISRHLAEAMGGTLSLQSVIGEGSTFTLTLRTAKRPRLVAVS